MKHIVASETAEIFTVRDLAAFIANILADYKVHGREDTSTEAGIQIATELVRNGWVSVIRLENNPPT